MEPLGVKGTFDRLLAKLVQQRFQCDEIDRWMRPALARGFEIPRQATPEARALADLARTPWLKLVVDNVVQAMYVDAISDKEGVNDDLMEMWFVNGLPALQVSNHRAMIAYGHSYVLISKSKRLDPGKARVRFYSPRLMAVEFDDPGADSSPSAALERVSDSKYILHVPGEKIYLSQQSLSSGIATEMGGLVITDREATGIDYVPVVRFVNQIDLDGNVVGEVEPFIPTAARINKTLYDRLLAQHFNSWKVKTATGLDLPEIETAGGFSSGEVDRQAAQELKMRLAQDDILISENEETRFGTLDATALDPFVTSWRSDIEALAAASQTPAHALTGQLVNLSADALAAARAPLSQKVYERKTNAGMSYSQMLRIMAEVSGMDSIAEDRMIRVGWQDTDIRSLSQAADALGKLRVNLGVPYRMLWKMIPGVEAIEIQEWEKALEEDRKKMIEADPLHAAFDRQVRSTVSDVDGGQ